MCDCENQHPTTQVQLSSSGRSRFFGTTFVLAVCVYVVHAPTQSLLPLPATDEIPIRLQNDERPIKKCRNITSDARCSSGEFEHLSKGYKIGEWMGKGYWTTAYELSTKNIISKHGQYVGLFTNCQALDELREATLSNIETKIHFGNLVKGAPNIVQLKDVVCFKGRRVPIFTKCPGSMIRSIEREGPNRCLKISSNEIKSIMGQAFEVVKFMMTAGGSGFWHSDLTLVNMLYESKTQKFSVVDLGNAEIIPDWSTARIQNATHRRLIEQYQYKRVFDRWHEVPYDLILQRDDILSVARLFGMLLNITLPGMDKRLDMNDTIHFEAWVRISGRQNFKSYLRKYNKESPCDYTGEKKGEFRKLPAQGVHWKSLLNDCNRGILDETAFDLFKGLLQFSYIDRRKFFLNSFDHDFFRLD